MNQRSNYSRQNRGKGGSGYRKDSGRSDFTTVLLFYILPFIVVNALIFLVVTTRPKGDVTVGETTDYISTTVELKVKSLLPIKEPVLTLDGAPVEITKTGSKTYTAVLNSNGVLEVELSSINQMKNIFYEQINILDDTPPTIEDPILDDGILSFRLEDSQAGIDYSSIHAYDDDTPEILPLSIDRSTGIVTFEVQNENLTICVKDLTGNEARVTTNPAGESVEEEALEQGLTAGEESGEGSEGAALESAAQ